MLAVLSAGGGAYEGSADAAPSRFRRAVLRAILAGAVVIHVGEALAAGRQARQWGLPARGWALQTLAVGSLTVALRRSSADRRPR